MKGLLDIKSLSIGLASERVRERPFVVRDLNLKISKAESVCLVGESGCGKSVTAISIMGLLPKGLTILNGQIFFEETDLLSLGEKELRRIRGSEISMIFQEPMSSLNPVLTIGQQLKEVFLAHRDGEDTFGKREIEDRCVELLKDVGLPHPKEQLKAYPHMLSGGQRQRVMIAMAMALSPKLIIADEPTTALDVTVQLQILRLLKRLQKAKECSLLFITHDLSLVPHVGDRIYVMYKGRIMEEGPSKDVVLNPFHPYTKALLSAIVDPESPKAQRLAFFKESPRLNLNTLNHTFEKKGCGCGYAERCLSVQSKCWESEPELLDLLDLKGRRVRCWLYAV